MNENRIKSALRVLAFNFGEKVTCERLNTATMKWIATDDAEINVYFLTEFEKGRIRNIKTTKFGIYDVAVAGFGEIVGMANNLNAKNVSAEKKVIVNIAKEYFNFFQRIAVPIL